MNKFASYEIPNIRLKRMLNTIMIEICTIYSTNLDIIIAWTNLRVNLSGILLKQLAIWINTTCIGSSVKVICAQDWSRRMVFQLANPWVLLNWWSLKSTMRY